MSKEKKIAIIGTHFSWDGGVDFLCYLVNAILFEPKNPVKIFLDGQKFSPLKIEIKIL